MSVPYPYGLEIIANGVQTSNSWSYFSSTTHRFMFEDLIYWAVPYPYGRGIIANGVQTSNSWLSFSSTTHRFMFEDLIYWAGSGLTTPSVSQPSLEYFSMQFSLSPEHFPDQFCLSPGNVSSVIESKHKTVGRPLGLLPIGLCLKTLYIGLVVA
ncbi:hypothetical protein TNCT_461261 [Trichonephila clavata]|uniref:Uncharacterized protein n=1 Tax=Trichonephila clavata TaxID=2740835 RepID=A0A8X6KRF9_TRICU|nr:hypothetical protein TNCT_461261 [Trichonephila clavata]